MTNHKYGVNQMNGDKSKSIRKTILSIIIVLVQPSILLPTDITNNITSNTTWTKADGPYTIKTSISISNGVTLTIEPGIIIKFDNGTSITANGKINAVGTSADSIFFTSNKETPIPLDWDRILVTGDGSFNSEFKYCSFSYARVGVSLEYTSSSVSHCLFQKNHRTGISILHGESTVFQNTAKNNINEGITITSDNSVVSKNIIYNNANGILIDPSSALIQNNLIYNNTLRGLEIRNTDNIGAVPHIINNTIDGNGANNINSDNSSPLIKNNIITNCITDAGIRVSVGAAPIMDFNNVWNNQYNYHGASAGANDISSDPLFINKSNADYHIQDTSPCIRKATPDGCPATDIEEKTRGNPPDIGAYENISDGDQSLPVELSSFTAIIENEFIKLTWETESEVNNLGFEVLRCPEKENDFILISDFQRNPSLKGKGNSTEKVTYSFTDRNIFPENTYYYKLIQVDYSGTKHEYSPIKVFYTIASKEQASTFKIYQNYPNPFNASTTIPFQLENDAFVNIFLFDVKGKFVKSLSNRKYKQGYNEITFSLREKSSGIYFCHIEADGTKCKIKLLYTK
jgi:hypothetical protein